METAREGEPLGTVLVSAREFLRFFDFQAELAVDRALVALNDLPAIKAMRYGMPVPVAPHRSFKWSITAADNINWMAFRASASR